MFEKIVNLATMLSVANLSVNFVIKFSTKNGLIFYTKLCTVFIRKKDARNLDHIII